MARLLLPRNSMLRLHSLALTLLLASGFSVPVEARWGWLRLGRAQRTRVASGDTAFQWFDQKVRRETDHMVQLYRQRFGNVINTDDARELSPHYTASLEARARLVMAVHEPASALAKAVYEQMLGEPVPAGKTNTVVFLGGGAGAGKSMATKNNPLVKPVIDKAHIVYDMTLASTKSSLGKVEQALDAGKRVEIIFVYRDPVDSMVKGILPRAEETGRTVPAKVAASTHADAGATMARLLLGYRNDPRVKVTLIDNRQGFEKARVAGPELLEQHRFDPNTLGQLFEAAVHAEQQAGKVSEHVARETLGREAVVPGQDPQRALTSDPARLRPRKIGEPDWSH